MTHCWTDGPSADFTTECSDGGCAECWPLPGIHYHACGSTCMLDADHEGDHEWTPDDQISVSFQEEGTR